MAQPGSSRQPNARRLRPTAAEEAASVTFISASDKPSSTYRKNDDVDLSLALNSLGGLKHHLARMGEITRLVLADLAELDERELEGRGLDGSHAREDL